MDIIAGAELPLSKRWAMKSTSAFKGISSPDPIKNSRVLNSLKLAQARRYAILVEWAKALSSNLVAVCVKLCSLGETPSVVDLTGWVVDCVLSGIGSVTMHQRSNFPYPEYVLL